MNPARCIFPIVGTFALMVLACDNEGQPTNEGDSKREASTGESDVRERQNQEPATPETLDAAVNLIMDELTNEDRQFIIDGGEKYEWMLPSHSGMGMRNGWGLWGDSPLSRHFHRMGIYHADDMSGIICQVVSRKVRKVPVELDDIIQSYREFWAEQDIIAPLDLSCPHCGKELRIKYEHDGVSSDHPKRVYFSGHCPDGPVFYFYHKTGWTPENEIKANKTQK